MKFNYFGGRKIKAFILCATMLGSVALFNGCKKNEEATIVYEQILEKNDEASDLLKYIEASEKFNSTNLKKYVVTKEDGITLPSPDYILSLIEAYQNGEKNNATEINYLKNIEYLINEYIAKNGYSLAHDKIKKATKEYAAELYGLDVNDIYFSYDFDKADGMHIVFMRYKDGEDEKSIEIKDKSIIEGVVGMNSTDQYSENGNYNKDRNRIIKDAITNAEILTNTTLNNDLYSEEEANKIENTAYRGFR